MLDIVKYLKSQINTSPSIGIVIGSGLNQLCDKLENKIVIQYAEIPSFISTTVDGHAGEFVIGNLPNSMHSIIFANGRFHYYEGIGYEKTHILIDIFSELGCSHIITTNSSGCLQPEWKPGDLMIIDAHLDATFRESSDQPKTISGDAYYSQYMINVATSSMEKLNITPRIGTYGWTLGPTYETPAEIEMLRELNVSAVGMSTVPEIVRTHELGLKLLSLACLTNYAVGISEVPLSHDEVVTQAKQSSLLFTNLIMDILTSIEL